MKKYLAIGLVLALFVVSVGTVLAVPKDKKVGLPDSAKKISSNTYYLGERVHKGEKVQGYAFVKYKKNFVKPTCNNNGICDPGEKKNCSDCKIPDETPSTCYAFMGKGVKWKAVEPYIVDPTNIRGITGINSTISNSINTWEIEAGVDILGNEVVGVVDGADMISPDDKNEVYFADIEDGGAIGVTIVWGIFRGSPSSRKIIEWDQIYDDVDYDWSGDCTVDDCTSKMDFPNIAIHELGHSMGMGDIYDTSCNQETMYGYADFGEINKRTLEAGDVFGIKELYK